jgi:benzoyl-CoA reductase subunit B
MPDTRSDTLVGRGVIDAGRLIRGWFGELAVAADRGDPTAYVFVMGSMAEVLRSFDIPVVFPEIHSLQTAVRHVADRYLSAAEDAGYSPDICGYVKADVGIQMKGGEHPMGRIPKPAIAVQTNACNTYLKWSEIWERMYGIPVLTVDVPGTRSARQVGAVDAAGDERDRRYVQHQVMELIQACERLTGRRFDLDRFVDTLRLTNEMMAAWRRVLELNRSRPACFNAVIEGTAYLGVLNALRGTREGASFFRDLVEELEFKAAGGIAALASERYRLFFVGVPCYPIFRRFHELFADRGGVFVGSSYLWFAGGGADLGLAYDLSRPLESFADVTLRSVRHAMDSMMFQDGALADAVDALAADGIVYHAVKSCRTTSTGLAGSRRTLMRERDLMCLLIDSDMMDRRVVSEAQMKNRIDAFFEGLEARQARQAATRTTEVV